MVKKSIFKQAFYILSGSFFYALGFTMFYASIDIAPGGISGLSIIINHLTSLDISLLYFVMNVPIVLFGLWKLGIKTMANTMIATVSITFMSDFISRIEPFTTDRIVGALFGGACTAIGMTLVFKADATTGGTDVIVLAIRQKYKHLSTTILFIVTDLMVIAASVIVYGEIETALYSIIVLATFSRIFDFLMYGGDSAKLLYIITSSEEKIAERILGELGIGFSYLKAIGPYENRDKNIILCAVKKHIYPKLRDVIKQEDPTAFLIVSNANEIFGEGFKDIHAREL